MWSVLRIGVFAIAATVSLAALSIDATAERDAIDCGLRNDVIGVSRVIELDTTGGLRFGNMQYKELHFLKEGEVVLTFDDGPLRSKSTAVLDALEAECTKATFFMVGKMAVTDPYMVREISRRGHTVGTHSWSHKNEGRLSRASAKREIELGISAVSAALGRPVAPFFRFPYLSDPNAMIEHLKSRDHGIFSIDVDSKDFRTRSGPAVVNRVMWELKREGKGILLFHDIQRSTARGIRALLRRLKREGFKIVHLVSNKPAKTLPKYDAIALKELAKRKKSWSSRPFSSSSVLWPVSNDLWLPAREPLKVIALAPTSENTELPTRKPGDGGGALKVDGVQLLDLSGTANQKPAAKRRKRSRSSSRSRKNAPKPLAQRPEPLSRPTLDPLSRQIYSD